MFALQLTGPEARKANNCSALAVPPAATLQVKFTGPGLRPDELQARNPEDRTIVLVLGPKLQAEPRFGATPQGTAQPEPEQFIGFVAARTVAARKCSPKPEHISPTSRRQHAKRAEPEGPTPKTRTKPDASSPKARLPTPKVPASPRKRCYMPDYGFIRYLPLYLQPLLQLVLRSSFYALPFVGIPQVSQALAPDPSALRPHA